MDNYGEELAAWYLRLNGFFCITNFVVHRAEISRTRSDIDVLAFRPPFVYEEVGGQAGDWDPVLFADRRIDKPLGAICEVKTGRVNRARLFSPGNIRYAVARLGIAPPPEVQRISSELRFTQSAQGDYGSVFKILVHNDASAPVTDAVCISLQHIRGFIRSRMERYPEEKYGSRHFFPSAYIQNLIDEAANSR